MNLHFTMEGDSASNRGQKRKVKDGKDALDGDHQGNLNIAPLAKRIRAEISSPILHDTNQTFRHGDFRDHAYFAKPFDRSSPRVGRSCDENDAEVGHDVRGEILAEGIQLNQFKTDQSDHADAISLTELKALIEGESATSINMASRRYTPEAILDCEKVGVKNTDYKKLLNEEAARREFISSHLPLHLEEYPSLKPSIHTAQSSDYGNIPILSRNAYQGSLQINDVLRSYLPLLSGSVEATNPRGTFNPEDMLKLAQFKMASQNSMRNDNSQMLNKISDESNYYNNLSNSSSASCALYRDPRKYLTNQSLISMYDSVQELLASHSKVATEAAEKEQNKLNASELLESQFQNLRDNSTYSGTCFDQKSRVRERLLQQSIREESDLANFFRMQQNIYHQSISSARPHNLEIPAVASQIIKDSEENQALEQLIKSKKIEVGESLVAMDALKNAKQRPSISLHMNCDNDILSDQQILIRKQIEYFEAGPLEMFLAHNRKKEIQFGQVGIRCIHCAKLPPARRPQGAIYYPASLQSLYQSAQNMVATHFTTSCKNIDVNIKNRLQKFKGVQGHGGKKYWADCARALGFTEMKGGGGIIYEAPNTKA